MAFDRWKSSLLGCLFAVSVCLLPAVQTGAQSVEARPVVVFAAASLQSALNAVASEWGKETGKRVVLSFGGSSALARQIEQGAPVDIFASADLEWMDWLQERREIVASSRQNLLGNRLVLITSSDNASALKIAPGFPLAEALGDSRLATANPQAVPLGRYAEAALTALGIWPQIRPKIAATDNARVALALVARGEARLGIVYATDAHAEPRVRVIDTFPAALHPPIVYPFAMTARSTNPDSAAFLSYMNSPAAQRIFEAEGFRFLR